MWAKRGSPIFGEAISNCPASEAISGGNYKTAGDLLRWSDPLVTSSADLRDERDRLVRLRTQVEVYASFKQLLDDARFACRFGSTSQKERGRELCRQQREMERQKRNMQEQLKHQREELQKQLEEQQAAAGEEPKSEE